MRIFGGFFVLTTVAGAGACLKTDCVSLDTACGMQSAAWISIFSGINASARASGLQISLGESHTCAWNRGLYAKCWGDNSYGQLGLPGFGAIGDDETPDQISSFEYYQRVTQLSAGGDHTCALFDDGAVYCWGRNDYGQLGLGVAQNIGDNEPPLSGGPVPLGQPAKTLSAGPWHTCAILVDDSVRCWGYNVEGALCTGNASYPMNLIGDNETPDSVPPISLGVGAKQVIAGLSQTTILGFDGSVFRCGDNANGYLGYGVAGAGFHVGDDETPLAHGPLTLSVTPDALGAGKGWTTCTLESDGRARCWGDNSSGLAGYGNTVVMGDDETLALLDSVWLSGSIQSIDGGQANTCALMNDGSLYCWGQAYALGNPAIGQTLGDNEAPDAFGPTPVGGPVRSISTGGGHTCVVLTDGTMRCFGPALFGRLGYGNLDDIGDNETAADAGPVRY